MPANAIPQGFHTVTPYLVTPKLPQLMDFLKRAFGATERYSMPGPNGAIAHAEMQVGDSILMMGQPQGESQATHSMLYLYVPDIDATYKKAIAAGGVSVREPSDQMYGDRNGAVKDPAGNEWWIATHKEDVSPQEMERRMAQHHPVESRA
jgi:PhnB protein